MTTPTWLTQGSGLVDKEDMRRFMKECFLRAGANEDVAEQASQASITSDYYGFLTHGINLLELNVAQLVSGQSDGTAYPIILNETPATAWVDGCNALGSVVSNFCMKLAMDKAEEMGVAVISAKGSNNNGTVAHYTIQALERGMIGICFSNTSALAAFPGTKMPFVGTNPICIAAPALYKDSFLLDTSCTRVAISRLGVCRRLQQRVPIGWAHDEFNRDTTDPAEALRHKKLLLLGHHVEGTAGHKGFMLALMVEMLCGVLSGGAVGPNLVNWRQKLAEKVGLSHCFIVINPKFFAPKYEARLFDMMYRMRGMDPVDPNKKVLVAGDLERQHMKKVDQEGGIRYPTNMLKHALALAHCLNVKPVTIK